MIRWSPLALGFFVVACSSGSGGTGGTGGAVAGTGGSGGGGTPQAAPLPYKQCAETARLGGFSVELKRNEGSTPYTAIGGAVKDSIDPGDVWQELAKEGDCRVMIGRVLVCTPQCAPLTQICAGNNSCIAAPVSQELGTVTVSGVGAPATLMKQMTEAGPAYSVNVTAQYPPFAPEVDVGLATTGGKIPAFTLAGRGVEPLDFPGTGLRVARNQPLPITWTASAKNKSARIHIKLDIAHHGGIASRIDCDVADTGSTIISAALVTKLMDQGVAGLPGISLTRQTVDSTSVGPACVDFVVASSEERRVEVEGVVSCNTTEPTCPPDEKDCLACPAGKKCQGDFQCK
jgi:hypothetical protein